MMASYNFKNVETNDPSMMTTEWESVTIATYVQPSLHKDTFYILLVLAGIFGLALIFNITLGIVYGICRRGSTTKQKVLILVLNLGCLFSAAADVYYYFYEYSEWDLGSYKTINCKTVKFVGFAGFGIYVFNLVAVVWDSIQYLQITVVLGKTPHITALEIVWPVLLSIFTALVCATVPAVATTTGMGHNATAFCVEFGSQYGHIFQIYSRFHEIACLFVIPVTILLIFHLYSVSEFGCSASHIDQHIESSEEVAFANILKTQMRWLLTIKCLALVYIVCMIPVAIFQLIIALFDEKDLTGYELYNNADIFLRRLSAVFKGVLAVLSPMILFMRHSCKRGKQDSIITDE